MKKILENIEAIRKEKNINQDVLAEKLGMSQSAYSRYLTTKDDLWLSQILLSERVYYFISEEEIGGY